MIGVGWTALLKEASLYVSRQEALDAIDKYVLPDRERTSDTYYFEVVEIFRII